VGQGFRMGLSKEEIFELSKIDPWFLTQIEEIIAQEKLHHDATLTEEPQLRRLKTEGFSDKNIARLVTLNGGSAKENDVYDARKALQIALEYNEVDTCAAEFGSLTPYLYSTTNITRLGFKHRAKATRKK
jgi:carbamoyl-phosphate synthase large subunit